MLYRILNCHKNDRINANVLCTCDYCGIWSLVNLVPGAEISLRNALHFLRHPPNQILHVGWGQSLVAIPRSLVTHLGWYWLMTPGFCSPSVTKSEIPICTCKFKNNATVLQMNSYHGVGSECLYLTQENISQIWEFIIHSRENMIFSDANILPWLFRSQSSIFTWPKSRSCNDSSEHRFVPDAIGTYDLPVHVQILQSLQYLHHYLCGMSLGLHRTRSQINNQANILHVFIKLKVISFKVFTGC